MKKLNNKGMSIVELIIVFAILLVLIYGMMSIIVRLKERSSEVEFEKELLEYKTLITKTIYDDLIKKELTNITCSSKTSCTLDFNIDKKTVSKTITVSFTDYTITYDNIVYEIPSKTSILIDEDNTSFNLTNNYFTINIPYYENKYNAKTNYGIYLVYPIGLE